MSVIMDNRSTAAIVTEEILKEDMQQLDENLVKSDELNDESMDSDSSVEPTEDPAPVEGWADAMSRILAKTGPKNAETMILAKESLPKMDPELEKKKLERIKKKKIKRAWEDMNFMKPDPLKKPHERSLQKIATRGVVQLFNAVRKHQTDMEEKLEEAKTENKKERLYKNLDKKQFLEILSGDKSSQENLPEKPSKTEQPVWKVLRDDFLTSDSGCMKDWDKCDNHNKNDKKVKKNKVQNTDVPKKKKKKS